MSFNRLSVVSAVTVLSAGALFAGEMDRPSGIKIGQRMTLRPYIAFTASYDSNVSGRSDGEEDVVWVVNPGVSLEYLAQSWSLKGSLWYNYNAYSKNSTSASQNSYHSYGEDLAFKWANSPAGEKGWSLMLSEKFQFINQNESVMDTAGQEYSSNREQFTFAGGLQRRFTNHWHADVNANYYWLDYDNNNNNGSSYGLYGWQRWGVGLETGYAFSPWTDLIIAGSYQNYIQENRDNIAYASNSDYSKDNGAESWTAQIGFGSYATEKLTYRMLAGWSSYRHKDGGQTSNGFTYTASGSWRISETWQTMLLATCHYQPTEREYGSSSRVDTFSWGVSHSMVQGKLRGTFDIGYQRTAREYAAVDSYDYDLDTLSARLGFSYTLNRYFSLFTNFEYRMSKTEQDGSVKGEYYTYDRFRATLGMRLTY